MLRVPASGLLEPLAYRSLIMSGDKRIICRPLPSWPNAVAMLVAFGFTWLMGWGLPAACLISVVASVLIAIVAARPCGRWTE